VGSSFVNGRISMATTLGLAGSDDVV